MSARGDGENGQHDSGAAAVAVDHAVSIVNNADGEETATLATSSSPTSTGEAKDKPSNRPPLHHHHNRQQQQQQQFSPPNSPSKKTGGEHDSSDQHADNDDNNLKFPPKPQKLRERKVSWGDEYHERKEHIADERKNEKTNERINTNLVSGNRNDDNDRGSPSLSPTPMTSTTVPPVGAPSSSSHSRKISWGGTTIEIPNAFQSQISLDDEDEVLAAAAAAVSDFGGISAPPGGGGLHPLLLGRGDDGEQQQDPNTPPMIEPSTLWHGMDYTKLELEEHERTKAAARAVLAAEAALHQLQPTQVYPQQAGFSSPLRSHKRNVTPALNATDLAKVHPFESQAESHVLNSIDTPSNQQRMDMTSDSNEEDAHDPGNEEEEEGIASLFTPVSEELLANVPEGSEAIFDRARRPNYRSGLQSNNTTSPASNTVDPDHGVSSHQKSTTVAGDQHTKSDESSSPKNQNTSDRPTWHRRNASNTSTGSGGSRSRSVRSQASSKRILRGDGTDSLSHVSNRGGQKDATSNNSNNKSQRHRRQKTVEEKLMLFNQTMERQDDSGNHHESGNYESENISTDQYHRRRTTSLDLFTNNMERLFGGSVSPTMNDSSGTIVFEQARLDEVLPLTSNDGNEDVHDDGNNNKSIRSSDGREFHPVQSVSVDPDNNGNRMRIESDIDSIAYTASVFDEENPPPKPSTEIPIGQIRDDGSAKAKGSSSGGRDVHSLRGVAKHDIVDNASHNGPTPQSSGSSSIHQKPKRSKCIRFFQKIGLLQNLDEFLKPRRPSIWKYTKTFFWLLLISVGVAALTFYLLGNPPTGIVDLEASRAFNGTKFVTTTGTTIDPYARASYSWWILFVLARLPATFALAKILELVIIDFMILDRRWVVSFVGPTMTLLIVQAKGWPSTLFFWAICNLALLYGESRFVAHWLYWAGVGLFNESNPSGGVPSSDVNLRLQVIALAISVCTAIKRLMIGYQQGRNIYLYYVEDLTKIATSILLISEVANLAARLERESVDSSSNGADGNFVSKRTSTAGIDAATQQMNLDLDQEDDLDEEEDKESASNPSLPTNPSNVTKNATRELLIADQDQNYVTGRLTRSQKRRIERLLGNWDEPEKETALKDSVSIGGILQFRTSLTKLDSPYPFSFAFGRAASRDQCIQAAQDLYLRLLQYSLDPTLHFNIIGLVALERDGSLNHDKLKSLMKLFRPGRDGRLSLIDFVKSIDIVYKKMKMLRASVRSSQKIDQAAERIFNIVFYAVVICVVLAGIGLDPLAIFVSLSTIVLAFSFMISRASSNYFEGLLFILYRRPYDIGDRIVVQPVDAATSDDGSVHWIVRDIDLFTTTCVYAYTNEVATLSNGSIANCRILNGARSLPSLNYVALRFGVDVTYEQIEIFREALALYVEARPREWSKLWGVRAVRVQADQGYVEYLVILEHVDTWQNLDGILFSRGQVRSFCHELARQLQMRYQSPPLPVDLTFLRDGRGGGGDNDGGRRQEAQIMGIISDQVNSQFENPPMDVNAGVAFPPVSSTNGLYAVPENDYPQQPSQQEQHLTQPALQPYPQSQPQSQQQPQLQPQLSSSGASLTTSTRLSVNDESIRSIINDLKR